MPWRLLPMKDVSGCEKPRGAAEKASIRGCPNGETRHPSWGVTPVGTHSTGRGNGELKHLSTHRKESNSNSLSSGERNGISPNRPGVKPGGLARSGLREPMEGAPDPSRSYQI